MRHCLSVFCLFIIFNQCLHAQNNIGLKLFGLSIHPETVKENAVVMPRKLDKNGVLVLNIGAEIMYEHFVYKDKYSLKFVQALYADCADQLGGFVHIGVRGRIFSLGKHRLYGGIGPTLVFRRSWLDLAEYKDQGLFQGDGRYQYLFLWYGGEFEYKYELNSKFDFAISFIPGYPDLLSLSLGLSYKL